MKKPFIGLGFSLIHLWILIILFGAILFETWILYPNIFHDIPRSFEIGMQFMVVKGPHDFFPPFGMLSLVIGICSLILNWSLTPVRYWILGSILIVVSVDFLLSVVYFWPRNTMMFEEGTAIHSVAFLQQTALEFQRAHWLRVAGLGAASAMSFLAFLKLYHPKGRCSR